MLPRFIKQLPLHATARFTGNSKCRVTNIPTFDVSIFHARYFRSREEDILTSPTSNNECKEEDISGNRIEDFESDYNESEYSLTEREKYKMLMPVLVNIGNLASCYSSNQFLEYFEGFKKIVSETYLCQDV